MAVEDPDGVATYDMLTEITTAVTDFAAWTGREGACVPSVEVRADVPEQEPDSDVVSLYQGDHHGILVSRRRPCRVESGPQMHLAVEARHRRAGVA